VSASRAAAKDEGVTRDVVKVALSHDPIGVEVGSIEVGLTMKDALHDRLILTRDSIVLLLAHNHVERRDRPRVVRYVCGLGVHDGVHLAEQDLVLAVD
jgi:hypothetical protein